MIVVLMGVTGSGKTTIGELLAKRMGTTFSDADDYHSPANKTKMRAGEPLSDDDRQPWLRALNGVLLGWRTSGKGGVLACSALKEKYRETLTDSIPAGEIHFVLLDASKELIAERLAHRHHEYMNPDLLDSQFKTLETPASALRVTNDQPPEEIADEILQRLMMFDCHD